LFTYKGIMLKRAEGVYVSGGFERQAIVYEYRNARAAKRVITEGLRQSAAWQRSLTTRSMSRRVFSRLLTLK
jgi:hypothetical protein